MRLQFKILFIVIFNGVLIFSALSPVTLQVGSQSLKEGASTGFPSEEVIREVYNYPNPFDIRKDGEEGKTTIRYTLNENAEVIVTLLDLLGYEVNSWTFPAGIEGGKKGVNSIKWDGINFTGLKVGKGGYICRIEVRSSQGTEVKIRKIGIIQ